MPFLYRSKDAELYAERPLIQLSCRGEVSAVHYNSRSIAPLRLARPRRARRSTPPIGASPRCCATRDFICSFSLRDGDLVVFDNQRTLHGRTAFSSAKLPAPFARLLPDARQRVFARRRCCAANSTRRHRS